jgi:hypothetical protein
VWNNVSKHPQWAFLSGAVAGAVYGTCLGSRAGLLPSLRLATAGVIVGGAAGVVAYLVFLLSAAALGLAVLRLALRNWFPLRWAPRAVYASVIIAAAMSLAVMGLLVASLHSLAPPGNS